ncbi:MAG: hypothetical protein Q8R15_01660 [Candidatus Micrarchaeota archaeon]|nr:hypothetical protein [Candidatus Micrarchaeota archaeon]
MIVPNDEQIKADILHKLFRKRKWGASHTSIDNLHKSCPPHLKGKYVEVADELVKNGLVLAKPTGYGVEVSLNPRRREEIVELVKQFFSILFP